jgi:IS5 family transposase
VSWESLTTEYTETVMQENTVEPDEPRGRGRPRKKSGKPKKRSTTDPEATLTTSSHSFRMEPSYKQHTAVDDSFGVIVDVATTTGETSEGKELASQIQRVEQTTNKQVTRITADAGYAHGANYQMLEDTEIDAVIPPQKEHTRPRNIPIRRFKYDAKHKTVRCPAGATLVRSSRTERGWMYRARSRDCSVCDLKARCISSTGSARTVLIVDGYDALLRARRRRLRCDEADRQMYTRHRWLVEGAHGEAKTQHGLRRAVRRGLANVSIQVYLTAAVINLKRLAAAVLHLLHDVTVYARPIATTSPPRGKIAA